MSLLSGLRVAASDAVALIDATRPLETPVVLSHGDLDAAASSLAAILHGYGLKRGDRVAVILPNGIDFALLYMACLYAGLVIVPLNPSLPVNTLSYLLDVARPTMLICDATNRRRLGDLHLLAWLIEQPTELLTAARAGGGVAAPANEDPDALFSITFTSGTTSRPKGVCHRAGAMLANVIAFNELTCLDQHARMLHVMPMSYMAGFLNTLLSPLIAGACSILTPPFNAAAALHFWVPAMTHGANAAWLSPTMAAFVARVARDPATSRWAREHMRWVFAGTAPLPPATKAAFEAIFGIELLESYGMTEVMLVSGNTARFARKAMSVGRLLPGLAVEARDNAGATLPVGVEGELWIQSPYALAGYLETDSYPPVPDLANGWLATGDVGRIDVDRDLFITGRLKDMIIHGGTNVSPRAIEDVLLTCPGIRDAAVIGLPHAFWGEEVSAVLLLEENAVFEAVRAEALALCKKNLPNDALPSRFVVERDFPRTSTGKVQKSQMRQSLLASQQQPGRRP